MNITATTSDVSIEACTKEELLRELNLESTRGAKSISKADLVSKAKAVRDLKAAQQAAADRDAAELHAATIEADKNDAVKQAILIEMERTLNKTAQTLDDKLAKWQMEMATSVQSMVDCIKRYGKDIADTAAIRKELSATHAFVAKQFVDRTKTFDEIVAILVKEREQYVSRVLNGSGWDDHERYANVVMAKYLGDFNENVAYAVKKQDTGRFFLTSL